MNINKAMRHSLILRLHKHTLAKLFELYVFQNNHPAINNAHRMKSMSRQIWFDLQMTCFFQTDMSYSSGR